MAQEIPNKKTEEQSPEKDEESKIPKLEDFDENKLELHENEEIVSQEEEPDHMEVKAREMGWVPQDEFKGDPDSWVDSKEFVGRAPLFDAIHQEKRRNKKLEEEVNKVKKFQKTLYDKAKKDAIGELQKKYDEATEDRDVKTAIETKGEIEKLEKETFEEAESENQDQSKENKEIYESWVRDNKWYEEDEDMKLFATAYGYKLSQDNPNINYKELLNSVSKKIKDKFPEKFTDPKQTSQSRSSAVSRPSTSSKTSENSRDPKKITISQLPEDVKPVYRTLVKSAKNPGGPLNHDEFIKQYLDIGGDIVK